MAVCLCLCAKFMCYKAVNGMAFKKIVLKFVLVELGVDEVA